MRRMLPILLCLILLLAGCTDQGPKETGSAGPETPAGTETPAPSPAAEETESAQPEERPEPLLCDGMGPLTWGDGPEALFGSDAPLEGARLDSGFLGYPCGQYCFFHEENGFYGGYYAFNEDGGEDGTVIYRLLRNALTGLYGAADELGPATGAPSIDEVLAGEADTCADLWSRVPASDGRVVLISLQLLEDGQVQLQFSTNPTG